MSNKEAALANIDTQRRRLRDAESDLSMVQNAIERHWPDTPTPDPQPDPDPPPQDGVVRLSIPGLVHQATQERPDLALTVPGAKVGDEFSRLRLEFDYLHRWNLTNPTGIHGIAYVHVSDRASDWPEGVIGYLIARAQHGGVVRFSEGLGVTDPADMTKLDARHKLMDGATYHVEIDYDARVEKLYVSIDSDDTIIIELQGDASSYEIPIRKPLQIWLGNRAGNPEVESWGAEWSNLEMVIS